MGQSVFQVQPHVRRSVRGVETAGTAVAPRPALIRSQLPAAGHCGVGEGSHTGIHLRVVGRRSGRLGDQGHVRQRRHEESRCERGSSSVKEVAHSHTSSGLFGEEAMVKYICNSLCRVHAQSIARYWCKRTTRQTVVIVHKCTNVY